MFEADLELGKKIYSTYLDAAEAKLDAALALDVIDGEAHELAAELIEKDIKKILPLLDTERQAAAAGLKIAEILIALAAKSQDADELEDAYRRETRIRLYFWQRLAKDAA